MIGTYFKTPTLEDCEIIAKGIMEENAKKPHMMSVTAEELMQTIEIHGGTAIYTIQNTLAGFIKIIPVMDNIYEWGSLFIREEFRGMGLSHKLIESVLTTYHDRALMCVTNVDQVKKACKKLFQEELQSSMIKKTIIEIIES